jgi:hypothetical protein
MKERERHSLFFPLALIAAGVIWILISMGKIPAENLWALARFWPFLLIGAGVGLILRSFWAPARMLVDVLVVGAAVLVIVFAPQLGWATPQWGLGAGFGTGFNVNGGVPGSGKLVSQTREVSGFTSISISYPAEMLIRQGTTESVKIEAEDNLIGQLSTETDAGILFIKNKVSGWNERVNPTKLVRITITVKNLNKLDFISAGSIRIEKLETDSLNVHLSGAGALTIDQLKAHTFDCRLSGAGSITASGVVDNLSLNISGVGSFSGADLSSASADVRLSGVGSAVVHPKESLTAQVSGMGSVRYYGNPRVDEHVSGLGSVNKIEQ